MTETNIGTRRVDFFLDKKVMIELKAMAKLDDVQLAKALIILKPLSWKSDC